MGLRANFWKILRSGDVIALVELLYLHRGTHSDIYELPICVNKHVQKGSDFRHRTSFLGITGKFCTVSTLMVSFWNNAQRHLGLG